MKSILIYIFMTLGFISYSQKWCNTGAVWHYGPIPRMGSYQYLRVEYKLDTIVDTKSCKKLSKTYYEYSRIFIDTAFATIIDTIYSTPEYIYEDSNRFYFYKNAGFHLLYDFNASVGDSWYIFDTSTLYNCCINNLLTVDSIGFDSINGEYLKYMNISCYNQSMYLVRGKIYEKIGNINSYLFPDIINCISDANAGGNFICYRDDSFGTYQVYGDTICNYIPIRILDTNTIDSTSTTINTTNKYSLINIYPNPFNNILFIDFPEGISNIRMYNIQGNEVSNYIIDNKIFTGKYNINTEYLQKGIYILQITDNKKINNYYKIIKY